jgi:hypothetical protein
MCDIVVAQAGGLLDQASHRSARESRHRRSAATIFVSDHGFLLGEHGLMSKMVRRAPGKATWMRSPRSPRCRCSFVCPGVKPGRTAKLACALDIAPAISELAGLSRQPEMQGLSLRQPKKSLACDDVESYPKSYPDVGLGPPGWQTGGFERGSA